jgi:Transglycosylase SLT domain
VGAAIAGGSGVARLGAALLIGGALLAAGAVSVLPGVLGLPRCAAGQRDTPPPSAKADETIPAAYVTLYQHAGAAYAVPWTVLAAIGAIESDHGRSPAPGVHSGVNAFGCCAGPMQFNLTNGPPSTWQTYAIDGDRDGEKDPYDPADAIASAGRYLRVLLDGARGDIARAVFGYNHSTAYVQDVLARARAYASRPESALIAAGPTSCANAGHAFAGPANLRVAERRASPRAYLLLPSWAMAGGRPAQPIDARLLENALWLVRNYRLRVTAAREGGHNTHGDGTALDLVPAEPTDQAAWDASAGALARDLGWTPACGASGTRPACQLVPAIKFIGYEGYSGHGSPRTCSGGCFAHLHISWRSPCYGTSGLAEPCIWVTAFAAHTDAMRR